MTRSGWSILLRRRVQGVELDRVHLRRGDEGLDVVDGEHRRVAGPELRVELAQAGDARLACFWKNSSPVMPSGARTSDTGRSRKCGRIRSAMLS